MYRKHIKKCIKAAAVLCGAASISALCTGFAVAGGIPDHVSIVQGESLVFHTIIPLSAKGGDDCVPADDISKVGISYTDDVKLFGLVPIKTVRVSIVKETMVVPCGCTFGVKFYTSGVMVIGLTDVDTKDGAKNPAYDAGIRTGDEIMAIDGKAISTNADVSSIVSNSGGSMLTVSLKRGDVGFSARFRAVQSQSDGEYKAGLWVRDSTAGIGTITYYNPRTLFFGGLGHGICDVSTGKIMPLMTGDVVKVNIQSIQKGVRGQPGEIQGTLENSDWGSLYANTETGVFGILNNVQAGRAIPVAMRQDVSAGPAYILATLDNTGVKKYAVTIEKINYNEGNPTKNMIIRVTDDALIRKTGGIVQGMSGCPIIQNGCLVGAVTHVFVNDPQKGYGIFAENMIIYSKALEKVQEKDVS